MALHPTQPGIRTGPNNLQNYPLIGAVIAGKEGSVQATLNSLPDTSFLIQFFSNVAADPSGYGQGQTLLGSQTVTTDGNGNALIVLDPAGGISSSAWFSATATDLSTGDTSEFSGVLQAQPVSVQFTSATLTVNSNAGVVAIAVERMGNSNATVSVNFASSNGTAIAGKNYLPAAGVLTFLPGPSNSLESFNITILPSSSLTVTTTTLTLTLSQPGGGATLGAISTEVVTIEEIPAPPAPPGPPGPPGPPVNANSPTVTSEQIITNGGAITALAFTFSQPLDPSRAENLGNYGYFVYTAGANGSFGTNGFTTLSSAVYNASAQSVTVTPSVPLPLNTFLRITIDGQTNTLLNNGLTNLSGGLLTGSDGVVGQPYVVTFGAGSRLSYVDGARNMVTLQLKRGGLMEMFRAPSGAVQQLQLVGVVPRKSTLTGSVRRGAGGTGRTSLPPIAGASGMRIRLKTPPFVFAARSLAITESRSVPLAESKPLAAAAVSHFSRRHWHRSKLGAEQ